MSELITATRRTVNFIATGGTGANILRDYNDNHPKNEHLLADERHCYVDTSLSNLVGVSMDKVYHICKPDGTPMDGAGGNRAAVYEATEAAMPAILTKFPPAEKNFIITSISGGTGPTVAHVMAKALQAKGHHVAIIAVRSSESLKRVDNTIKVLTGFEGITQFTKRPLVIALFENDESKTHDENNILPLFAVSALSILSSGMNKGMDSADVGNVFDYNTVTHHAPGVALLHISSDVEKFKNLGTIAAYAAVARSSNEVIPKLPSDYDTAGYMRGNEGEEAYGTSFYFAVSPSSAATLFKELIKDRDALEQQKQHVQPVVSLLAGSNAAEAAGKPVF